VTPFLSSTPIWSRPRFSGSAMRMMRLSRVKVEGGRFLPPISGFRTGPYPILSSPLLSVSYWRSSLPGRSSERCVPDRITTLFLPLDLLFPCVLRISMVKFSSFLFPSRLDSHFALQVDEVRLFPHLHVFVRGLGAARIVRS